MKDASWQPIRLRAADVNPGAKPVTVSRQRLATMSDVARAAGVSPMTVSRVINRREGVSQQVREQVQSVIAQIGYFPNEAARALSGNGPPRVCMLFRNPYASHFPDFVKSSVEVAGRGLIHLMIKQCPTTEEAVAAVRELAPTIEGFILAPPLGEAGEVRRALIEARVPGVALATPLADPSITAVGVDDRGAAAEMTRHLLALGHRRIAFIEGNPDQMASIRRRAGYEDALSQAGLTVDPLLIAPGMFSYRSGLDAAERLLDVEQPPTAIFASNDEMAAATVTVALSRRLNVPGDLSVCGFDDAALATMIWPQLTTIRQPLGDMAERAVTHLAALIDRRRTGRLLRHERIELGYTLVRRQSDAAPRVRPKDRAAQAQ